MTSRLSKNWKNSMKMSYSLYRRVFVDLAYLKEPVVNAFQVVSFTRKKSHSQFLPEKLSKFNSTLHSDLLIECQIKHIVRKNFAGRFRLPPQPNGAMQNQSMLRPGYRSVRCLDTKCTVGILRNIFPFNLCRKKKWSTLNFMLQENASSW